MNPGCALEAVGRVVPHQANANGAGLGDKLALPWRQGKADAVGKVITAQFLPTVEQLVDALDWNLPQALSDSLVKALIGFEYANAKILGCQISKGGGPSDFKKTKAGLVGIILKGQSWADNDINPAKREGTNHAVNRIVAGNGQPVFLKSVTVIDIAYDAYTPVFEVRQRAYLPHRLLAVMHQIGLAQMIGLGEQDFFRAFGTERNAINNIQLTA